MYSSNHLVRHCSILNLHIIITQMVLPNQSKHMDIFLRELWVYYAGPLAHTCTHTHTHTRARTHTFPRLNKCQIRSSQQEITSRSWGRSFLRANHPLHSLWLLQVHVSAQLRHTHTYTLTPVTHQYGSSTIWRNRAASYWVKIACSKRICKHGLWRLQRLSQKRLWNHRCEECNVTCVVFICAQVDNVPLNVLLGVLSVFTLRSQLSLSPPQTGICFKEEELLHGGAPYLY